MFAVTGDLCGGYTPIWLQMAPPSLIIGEGCDVGESKLYSYPLMFFDITLDIKSIGVSSTDDAWWRLGESACRPVTTPANTTTLTTQPRTSEVPLANHAMMNETMHKYMNMGRSGGAVCNNSLTVMTMVVTLMSFVKY
ncbi:uncharacterized protein LOC125383626 [Haliotis rufescens]|uniref:uncharacterized protein LOC125383626 n=1 Tax=Haliotis rufescens TaxID=6454 RepID=UPI00201F170E|nr:uncharacterized protein LOC125383626 [Haliotis rufescens]